MTNEKTVLFLIVVFGILGIVINVSLTKKNVYDIQGKINTDDREKIDAENKESEMRLEQIELKNMEAQDKKTRELEMKQQQDKLKTERIENEKWEQIARDPDDNTFKYFDTLDSADGDFNHLQGNSVVQLKVACLKNSNCKAFNTNGWMKNKLNSTLTSSGAGTGIYIKQKEIDDHPFLLMFSKVWDISHSGGSNPST